MNIRVLCIKPRDSSVGIKCSTPELHHLKGYTFSKCPQLIFMNIKLKNQYHSALQFITYSHMYLLVPHSCMKD